MRGEGNTPSMSRRWQDDRANPPTKDDDSDATQNERARFRHPLFPPQLLLVVFKVMMGIGEKDILLSSIFLGHMHLLVEGRDAGL